MWGCMWHGAHMEAGGVRVCFLLHYGVNLRLSGLPSLRELSDQLWLLTIPALFSQIQLVVYCKKTEWYS